MSDGPALVIGTAGHVDHGKTALVAALTGIDTDRLPEEKARGISIELGYARLELDDGRRLSVVDVPGHERFIRTMVAGATGIDMYLLVIDAREGPRAQTLEHLEIIQLLGIDRGVIAVTKSDLVDADALARACRSAARFAPGAPVVAVSAKTGAGLGELRAAIAGVAVADDRRSRHGAARLFVDRVFTLHGIGTVVTGTLWSGEIAAGDELELAPRRTRVRVRVRSVEVHGDAVERAGAGQRVAVAVTVERRNRPHRGDALVTPGAFPVSYRVDVRLDELLPIANGTTLTAHHGTSAVVCRIVRDEGPYAQLRLRRPLMAARGDRVVLRSELTLGAATVLDPAPSRRFEPARVAALDSDDPAGVLAAVVDEPVALASLRARALLAESDLERGLATLGRAGEWVFSPRWLERTRAQAHARLRERAEGLSPAELLGAGAWVGTIVPLLELEAHGARLYLPGTANARPLSAPALELERRLSDAALAALAVDDRGPLRELEAAGRAVALGERWAISVDAYAQARATLVAECEAAGTITLPRYRDLLGIARRIAQLLLERFDADRLTLRVGDERRLRSSRPERSAR